MFVKDAARNHDPQNAQEGHHDDRDQKRIQNCLSIQRIPQNVLIVFQPYKRD